MDGLKQLRKKFVKLDHWLSKFTWYAEWVCRQEDHIFLVRVDKPLSKQYFAHYLYCGRCFKIFGKRMVRIYDYDTPGYESSMRIWLASLKTIKLDSKTIKGLGENLIKLRFRVQNEPSMYEKIKKAKQDDDSIPSLIAKPTPGELSRIFGPGSDSRKPG